MVNQNIQPLVLTETVYVQADSTTDYINIDMAIGQRDQLNLFAIYCRIVDGNFNLRDINDDGVNEFTFTDVQPPFLPTRADVFGALPMCCNPRTWQGLYLKIYRNEEQMFRRHDIPLSILNNDALLIKAEAGCAPVDDCPQHTGKILPLKEPLAFEPSEELRIRVQNTNPIAEADQDADTYSAVKISFLCETVRKDATLEIMTGKDVAK